MTQEEKTENFLDRLQRVINNAGNIMVLVEDLEEAFPELKERNDERIREELISFIEELSKLGINTNFDKWTTFDCAKWIEWVKKQDPTRFEEELEKAYKCADEVQYQKGYEAAKREIEKQGEMRIVWHDISEEPNENEELLCEWKSGDCTRHDVVFYHKDNKSFLTGAYQTNNVIRWARIK